MHTLLPCVGLNAQQPVHPPTLNAQYACGPSCHNRPFCRALLKSYMCLILEENVHTISQVSDLMSHLIPEQDLIQGTSQDRMFPTLGNTHIF